MKKTLLLFLIAAFVFLMSCGRTEEQKSKAVVKVKYHTAEANLYLNKVHARNIKMIDSADLSVNNEFLFSFNSTDHALFRLETEGLYPLILVIINGDTVMVEQTDDPAWPYRVTADEECMLLVSYLEKLNRDQYKVDSLSKIFHASKSHPDFVNIREDLNAEYISIRDAHKEWVVNFITKNPSSFAALVMVNSFFMEELLFNTATEFKYYELVANAVMNRMPENKYARDLNEQVGRIRESNEYEAAARERLANGKVVPSFELRTIKGAMTGPQDFKGNELLIYFWAAGDARSRQANGMIKEIYKAYNPLGLEVLAISFDQSAKLWEAAIELDSLPGVHIGDASGAASSLHKLFNLKMRLPAYFLIDKEGRIYDSGRDFNMLPQSVFDLFDKPIEY
jgi:peroxiredoxin